MKTTKQIKLSNLQKIVQFCKEDYFLATMSYISYPLKTGICICKLNLKAIWYMFPNWSFSRKILIDTFEICNIYTNALCFFKNCPNNFGMFS